MTIPRLQLGMSFSVAGFPASRFMPSRFTLPGFILGICFLLGICALPLQSPAAPSSATSSSAAFATPVSDGLFDSAAAAEWVDGVERQLATPDALRQLLWTQAAAPTGKPLVFGVSAKPGIRHLRLGFTSPVGIGSVLVRGGGELSVLRPDAAYPGNLSDESQWIPAQRVVNRQPTVTQVAADGFALWTLPAGTKTRALRFTANALSTDATYAGSLSGVYLLSGRFANLAPQSAVITSANNTAAALLTNEKSDGSRPWDNGPDFRRPVTTATAEWITLSWPRPVPLEGIAILGAGFSAANTQIFAGPETVNPANAPEADWKPIAAPFTLQNQYPRGLAIDWVDFGRPVTTRAVRLRITAAIDAERHAQLAALTRNGNRVWLSELMALSPVQAQDFGQNLGRDPEQPSDRQAAIPESRGTIGNAPTPPIPVRFNLAAPGYVSLVIDDAQGNRVRNLVSDTEFPAGPNTVWWDGTDDLGRNSDAANHGVYLIPTHFVAPGTYTVRGLYHRAIDLRYEMSVYNSGHPAWETADGTGGWLTNHTPPSSALFVPAEKTPGGKPLVYLGSYVSEGGAGLAWVDLEGNKQGGRGWVGGSWTAAPFLARDTGPRADPAAYAYVGAVWHEDIAKGNKQQIGVVRLTALDTSAPGGLRQVLNYRFDQGNRVDLNQIGGTNWLTQMGGLAIRNGLAVVSLRLQDQLLFSDVSTGKVLGSLSCNRPRGLAFDAQGRLLVLSSEKTTGISTGKLLRYTLPDDTAPLNPQQIAAPETLIAQGLEDPAGITLDAAGNLYISDRGNSSQVKIFSPAGKFLHAIGHAGPPQAGPYDPMHMNNPRGLTIDSNNHLWVAEEDFQPKRVSLWTLDGTFLKAFYGPSEYGGGGSLDPQDRTRFYYRGMEFKLDWKTGTDQLASVLYRPAADDRPLTRYDAPNTVLYSHGHRYFTNAYIGHPTNGVTVATLYLYYGGTLKLAGAFGRANDIDILKTEAFRPYWPPRTDPNVKTLANILEFSWSDTNGNGKIDPGEVGFLKSSTGFITIMPDLAMINAFVDGKAMRYLPTSVSSAGVPTYDLQHGQVIVDGAQRPSGDGGGQVLYSPEATVLTTAPTPFSRDGVGGVDAQNHRWSYPNLWPGLHPAHTAPVPDRPGELVGATRLLGGFVNPAGTDIGPLWAINGNFGNIYLFTRDGFYVTQLFQDVRVGKPWSMPEATRNMLLNDITPHDENFFPSLNQTSDGKIYLIDGGRTTLVRVDGLDTLRRLPPSTLEVTRADLDKAHSYLQEQEASRQQTSGARTIAVTLRPGPAPTLNTVSDTLKNADWATIDRRTSPKGWTNPPDEAEAAITIAGGRLYAVFRTHEPNLLKNSGALPNAPFKTGGALDLMIGADPHADPKREAPVAGDLRLLVYQVAGKTRATLYRAVVPGTAHPIPFSSPDRTITLDEVSDVSDQVEFASPNGASLNGSDAGTYIFSIPLATLGLKPVAGESISADIGILRGTGVQTIQRVYWSNKATGITSDVPSEAELVPRLWGKWVFQALPQAAP